MRKLALLALFAVPMILPRPAYSGELDTVKCGAVRTVGVLGASGIGLINGVGTAVVALGNAGAAVVTSPLYFSEELRDIAVDNWEFKDTRHAAFLTKTRTQSTYHDIVSEAGCVSDRQAKASYPRSGISRKSASESSRAGSIE